MSGTRPPLASHRRPGSGYNHRPMRPDIYLVYLLLRLVGCLPLRWLHALGSALGWLSFHLARRSRRVVATNLRIARPQLQGPELQRQTLLAMQETCKSGTELAKIWGRGPEVALKLVREVCGQDLLDEALASGKGVIIAAPHHGCWELLNFWVAARSRLAILYRPPRIAALEQLLRKARGPGAPEQIRADAGGVRTLYRWLSGGGAAGVLPDQKPRAGEGQFAPFFSREALTMVLLPRVAQRTGSRVLYGFVERLPAGQGYRVHFLPAAPEIFSPDIKTACTALNRGVEACVEVAFSQYQWHYKRFSLSPTPGEPSPYR